MAPVYRKRPGGRSYARVKDAFTCPEHGTLARGRRKVHFLL